MKSIFFFVLLSFSFLGKASQESIRLNQVGYHPNGPKVAIIVSEEKKQTFEVVNVDGKVVLNGKLSAPVFWDKSGEQTQKADFSALTTTGVFQVKVGKDLSWPFEIKQHAWKPVSKALMKSFYYQRASFELTEEFAGKYKRPKGHADNAVNLHESTREKGVLNAPGGWYDAGDFGKYIVSAGITLGNMMSLHELLPQAFPDGSVNIPESGNGVSDMLDEARYELDWFKNMQDSDGGVFVKMTTAKYPDMMLPHNDPLTRNVYGKSTASTLHFAATMAMASRVYAEYYPEWAKDSLARAERAWNWAIKNNNEIFTNPEGVLSGDYSNKEMSDEFLWAAAELYISAKQATYKKYLLNNIEQFNTFERASWANVKGLAFISLSFHDSKLPPKLAGVVNKTLIEWSDQNIAEMNLSAYQIPQFNFVWGSNSDIGAAGMSFLFSFHKTQNKKYLEAAAMVADYILGKNATGYSFVTGFGGKQVENLHHSVSISDGIKGPLPGFIPGGVNENMEDGTTSEYGHGVKYQSTFPAKAYMDSELSYASNENDICYTAPNLVLISAVDYLYSSQN